MKIIPLGKGLDAYVDDSDYELVSMFSWWECEGYAVRALPRRGQKNSPLQMMHVFLLGKEDGREIDHRNGNGLDNQRGNLRQASHSENLANRGKPTGTYASAFKGVTWSRNAGKWRAYIKKDYRQKHLGYFELETDAAAAHDTAAKQIYGEFAQTNLPNRH